MNISIISIALLLKSDNFAKKNTNIFDSFISNNRYNALSSLKSDENLINPPLLHNPDTPNPPIYQSLTQSYINKKNQIPYIVLENSQEIEFACCKIIDTAANVHSAWMNFIKNLEIQNNLHLDQRESSSIKYSYHKIKNQIRIYLLTTSSTFEEEGD